jgi:hypothetical protein
MGKRALHLPTTEEVPGQKKTADTMINALIEKRRLQQGALIKIMSSIDTEAANPARHKTPDSIRKKNSKSLNK